MTIFDTSLHIAAIYSPIFLYKAALSFMKVDRMNRCGDIADISLRMRICAIFLLTAEVLVTDSVLSHTPFPIYL